VNDPTVLRPLIACMERNARSRADCYFALEALTRHRYGETLFRLSQSAWAGDSESASFRLRWAHLLS
jgi:hypothetical protein